MFGFGKTKIPVGEVAALMARGALLPVENPTEQDLMFQAQAVRVGMDKNRFTFEAVALQAHAMGQAINRERLEGRIRQENAELLLMSFLRAFNDRLQNTTNYDFLVLGLGPDEAFELMAERAARYSEPLWEQRSPSDIYRLFAESCGLPDSDVLERIGWSLYQVRGDSWGDWLKTVKIVW